MLSHRLIRLSVLPRLVGLNSSIQSRLHSLRPKNFDNRLPVGAFKNDHRFFTLLRRQYSTEPKPPPSPRPFTKFTPMILLFIGTASFFVFSTRVEVPTRTLTFNEFVALLEKGGIDRVEVSGHRVFAKVFLHPDGNNPPKEIYMQNLFNLETVIRDLEKRWKIPSSDALSIYYDPVDYLGLVLWASTLLCITGGFTLLTINGMMRSKQLANLLNRVSKQQPPPASSKSPSQKPISQPKEESSASKESPPEAEDQPGWTSPFSSWDPFSTGSIKPTTSSVKFSDVAGMHASKEEVMEFVAYLKDPQKYQALGAKLPKGALLLGPPGTGKTLLVKALANEADVPFYTMAGSEFVEIIGGLGASRMRQLFKAARSKERAIIFIDELDSVGRKRHDGQASSGGGGGLSEMEQTLNQLLVEMDGMSTSSETIVFAATNRSDLLDPALLRAGRFDRHIFIDLPNLAERKELLCMYVGKYLVSPDVDQNQLVDHFAYWTPGMSGADIARLCNEAALIAARRDDGAKDGLIRDDFDQAYERLVVGSAKKYNPLSPPERRVAAVQEAGRALIAWLLPRAGLMPIKLSIVPRTLAGDTGGLGFTQMMPQDRRLYNSQELADRVAVLLGGRAAEQLIFNAVSDASQRYLRAANDLALKQVREWGMSDAIGHVSFKDASSDTEFTTKPYSQRTQALIELESQRLVSSAFARCLDLLKANQPLLQSLIDKLIQHEVVSHDELQTILNANH